MHKELITPVRWSMVLLDDVVDVLKTCVRVDQNEVIRERESYSHCGADKQSKDEGYNRRLRRVGKKTKESTYQRCNEN
jgi:hypothetical protein